VVITNPYQPYPQDGVPPANPAVTLPKPDHGPNSGANSSGTPSSTVVGSHPAVIPSWWLWPMVAVLAIIALAAIGFGVSMARRPAASGGGAAGAVDSERQRREQAFRDLLSPRAPNQRPPDGGSGE
jgi:hypothetical protein